MGKWSKTKSRKEPCRRIGKNKNRMKELKETEVKCKTSSLRELFVE